MKRLLPLLVLLVILTPAQGEHASVSLRILRIDPASGDMKEQVESRVDQEPPSGGVVPRPLFKAKAGEPLAFQFFFTNTYPHGVLKEATIRYFVVRQAELKQKKCPELTDENTVVQGSFVLNLKPKGRVGARVAFTIREPGVYLLRVDSLNTQSDHEHFSAIDVLVE